MAKEEAGKTYKESDPGELDAFLRDVFGGSVVFHHPKRGESVAPPQLSSHPPQPQPGEMTRAHEPRLDIHTRLGTVWTALSDQVAGLTPFSPQPRDVALRPFVGGMEIRTEQLDDFEHYVQKYLHTFTLGKPPRAITFRQGSFAADPIARRLGLEGDNAESISFEGYTYVDTASLEGVRSMIEESPLLIDKDITIYRVASEKRLVAVSSFPREAAPGRRDSLLPTDPKNHHILVPVLPNLYPFLIAGGLHLLSEQLHTPRGLPPL